VKNADNLWIWLSRSSRPLSDLSRNTIRAGKLLMDSLYVWLDTFRISGFPG